MSDLRRHLPNRRQSMIASQLGLRAGSFSDINENQNYPVPFSPNDQRRGENVKEIHTHIDSAVIAAVRRRVGEFF